MASPCFSQGSKSSKYPEPLVIPPQQEHKQTFIILHGRGSNAEAFAESLLHHPTTSSSSTFQSHFPNAKFVFPTASLRRAVRFNRSIIRQWFDVEIDKDKVRHVLQIDGLRESICFIHGLLKRETEEVGAGDVILMGLSQGCAAGLLAAMTWEGERIGAFVGMCGYLPFMETMRLLVEQGGEEDDVLFANEKEESTDEIETGANMSKLGQVMDWLRDQLDMVPKATGSSAFTKVPIFLGHGTEDESVPCMLGKQSADFLRDLDVHVQWKEYDRLGHWYSEDMLRDMVQFLKPLEH